MDHHDLWHIEARDREALRRDGVLVVCGIGVGFVVALAVLFILTRVG